MFRARYFFTDYCIAPPKWQWMRVESDTRFTHLCPERILLGAADSLTSAVYVFIVNIVFDVFARFMCWGCSFALRRSPNPQFGVEILCKIKFHQHDDVCSTAYKYLSDNTCTITFYVNWQPPNELGTNSYRLLVLVGQPAHFFSVELTTCLVHLESEQVGAQTGNKSSEPHHTRKYGCVLSLIRQWGIMRDSWLRNFSSQSALRPMLHLRLRQDPESQAETHMVLSVPNSPYMD